MRHFAPIASIVCLFAGAVFAEEKPAERTFAIGEGKVSFTAAEGWKKVQPKSRIVEAEFEVPAAKGDETPGRLTAMGAGGDVEANIARWAGQFVAPAGAEVKPQIDKLTVDGSEVHVVSLTGTYKDSPAGPFAGGKTVMRENYQMLGAICVTKAGNYFLKLYGPKATIAENEKGFRAMVESLKVSR
jgi:gluconolactonase